MRFTTVLSAVLVATFTLSACGGNDNYTSVPPLEGYWLEGRVSGEQLVEVGGVYKKEWKQIGIAKAGLRDAPDGHLLLTEWGWSIVSDTGEVFERPDCQMMFDHHSYLLDAQFERYGVALKRSLVEEVEQISALWEVCPADISVIVYSPFRETAGDRRNKSNVFVTSMQEEDTQNTIAAGPRAMLALSAPLQAKIERGEYVVRFELN